MCKDSTYNELSTGLTSKQQTPMHVSAFLNDSSRFVKFVFYLLISSHEIRLNKKKEKAKFTEWHMEWRESLKVRHHYNNSQSSSLKIKCIRVAFNY